MSYSGSEMINDFLEQVRKRFPEWLHRREDQMQHILYDLEQQLLIKAKKIAGGTEPDIVSIQQAISEIGTPKSIADVYRSRSTPKFFISEELWPFYVRILLFFLAIVVVINFLVAIFQFFVKPWYQVLGEAISGVYLGFLIVIVIITVLFVYFSMEGFFPEDFGKLPKFLGIIPRVEPTERFEERKERAKAQILTAKEKAKESVIEAKETVAEAIIKAKEKFYRISVGELVAGAFFGIVFGLIFISQPFVWFVGTGWFATEFLDWLRFVGLLIFIGGIICLIRLGVGTRNITGQQILLVMTALFEFLYIPLLVYLYLRPDIFPILLFSGFLISSLTGIWLDIYHWIIIIIILLIVLGFFVSIYKAVKMKRYK